MFGRINVFLFCIPQIVIAHQAIFNHTWNHLTYFHAPDASHELLDSVANKNLIFEIDLSWAHSTFNSYVREGHPYIGHPEEFYTKLGKPFPSKNIDILEFQNFLIKNPSIKVLIDIKDEAVYPFLQQFIQAVGPKRCIVHAFVKNWTHIPPNATTEPHWYREDVDLFALNDILVQLNVPLIANCRGFSDANVKQNNLVSQMIEDSKRCSSILSLGLYYPGVPLPNIQFLHAFNDAGYYAWVNGNIPNLEKKLGNIRYVAMADRAANCTDLSR